MKHFSKLAAPDENPPDSPYYRDVMDIEIICSRVSDPTTPLDAEKIEALIRELNRNKAADFHGLTAEHLIHAGPAAIQTIQLIMNQIVLSCKLPSDQKTGALTPVYKKAGSHNPFNQRVHVNNNKQTNKHGRGETYTHTRAVLFLQVPIPPQGEGVDSSQTPLWPPSI